MTRRPRRRLRWVLGGAAILAVLAVAGSLAGFRFASVKAPASLTLPGSGTRAGTSAAPSAPGETGPGGVWKAGPGSIAGWRVQEVFLWQQVTVAGRTSEISGSLTMAGTSVSKASFTVNMASATTDKSERAVLDVNADPTATFVLTSPIELGTIPADGTVRHAPAAGHLTMHGLTEAVRIAVRAERTGSSIYVLADVPIAFTDWKISVSDGANIYGIKSPGTRGAAAPDPV